MRLKLAVFAMSTATSVAVLVAGACASKADAPTQTPTPATSTQPSNSSASPAAEDAYILYRDDTGTLSARDFLTAKTYHNPIDATKEVIVQNRCTPDGSRIAYLKQIFDDAHSTTRDIIIRGNNAPSAPLTVSSLVQWIAWSPDGNKLAMVEWDGQTKHGKLYIYDIATHQQTTILNGDHYIGNIGWSPQGDRLTFYLQTTDFSGADIYTLKVDGSDLKRLTPGDGSLIWLDPTWSPDGTWIVAAGAAEQAVQLYRIDPETGAVTQLTTSSDIYKRNPYFSPDGSLIAYTGSVVLPGVSVNWNTLHQYAIFTINPDGTNERSLTADPRGTTPGPNDPFLNAYMLGWCSPGPWLDDLWTEAEP
jgi:dipeptidyl aminopeptidase/acylaminoacyl peptidase